MKIINKLTLLLAGVLCFASCGKESDAYNNPTTATLPIEKRYQGNGTYAVDTTSFASNNDTIARLLVAHPSALASSTIQWPLVMVCNPSNTSGEDMMPIMRHLASWGFVVVGNMDQQTGTGRTMSLTLDEFLTLIETAGNFFNGKIDTTRIGIFGMSQGAFGTVKAVTQYANGCRYRVVYLGSCPQPDFGDNLGWDGGYTFADFNVPVLMLSGAGFIDANSISPLDKMQANYEALPDGVPCAMARRKGKDHEKMGGEGDPYMTAWFCHWLLGDTEAAKAFCGTESEMLQNERWIDAQIKNM